MYEAFMDKPLYGYDGETIYVAIERLSTYVPVSESDSYAEGYRDGLAQARKVLGEMLVE